MTDKELLELAAKAAGLTISHWAYGDPYVKGKTPVLWDPLEYDRDALRLAVQLGLIVSPWGGATYVENVSKTVQEHECHDNDEFAATRRAIVKAAAALCGNGALRDAETNAEAALDSRTA